MQWYLKRKTIIKKKKKFESKLQREIQNFTCHTGETKKNLRLQEEFNPRPSDKTSYIPSVSGTSRGRVTRRGGGGKESLEQERKLIWCDKKTFCFFLHQSFTPPINNCWISRLIFISYFIKISSNIYFLIQQTLG